MAASVDDSIQDGVFFEIHRSYTKTSGATNQILRLNVLYNATMAKLIHPKAMPKRPLGEPTRGKTARNRLRRVDNFLAMYDPALIRRNDGDFANACFVDLGYGEEPWTTLESAQRLRKINPRLPVLGVEIDAERVADAQPFADSLTEFRLGGFNLPLRTNATGNLETVRAIRAFNVLRQYAESAVAGAWEQMMRSLLPGGLLIEGTSDPLGRIWVANLLRKGETDKETRRMNFAIPLFSAQTFGLVLILLNFRNDCPKISFIMWSKGSGFSTFL